MLPQSPYLPFSAPIYLSLELTCACNSMCPGCGNVWRGSPAPSALSAAHWREILEKLKPSAYRTRVTGGEPTLHPEFETIIAHLGELDMTFSVFTNARWNDPARLLAFLPTIPQFKGFLISLHGADAATHETFTSVSGSFAETVANVRLTVKRGIPAALSTVITRHNYDQPRALVRLAQKLGVNRVAFNRYLGKRDDELQPTPAQLKHAVAEIEQLHQEGAAVKIGNCIPQCFVRSSSTGCLAGVAYATIDPRGNLRPCNHAPLHCGNLLQQSLDEIWRGETLARWRRMIPAECLDCAAIDDCHAGCQAVALLNNLERDPLMRAPIRDIPQEPLSLELDENSCPVGLYDLRVEDFGYVLLRGTRITVVDTAAKQLLAACNGESTLRDIATRFGQEALDLVGSLYWKGFIDLS